MDKRNIKVLILLFVGWLAYQIGVLRGVATGTMEEAIITGILVSCALAIVFTYTLKEDV